ncbi:MAG: hypothetical protein [Bacteriophage sp.]|nr:MAG: hypothetical protein [Bacteriophage sp.]
MYNSLNKKNFAKLQNEVANHIGIRGEQAHTNATTSEAGFLSPKDKLKLNNFYTSNGSYGSGVDVLTLPSGFYEIIDAINGPDDAFKGSPVYYEVYRVGVTRFSQGELIMIKAYQRSSGRHWLKTFYPNQTNNNKGDKGWGVIPYLERLLSSEEIVKLNDGEVISYKDKIKANSLSRLEITYRYARGLKCITVGANETIVLDGTNIVDDLTETIRVFNYECAIQVDKTNETIQIIRNNCVMFDNDTQKYIVTPDKIDITAINIEWR